ncbi:MAG: Ig-like domain-containing protein, partial [Mycobacterium sp.]
MKIPMPSPRTLAMALSFACVVVLAITGCGGGDSAAPAGPAGPAAVPPTLGPGASTITSSDGKVTVSVGDNALQAPAVVSVAPAEPDAAMAADPSLVPGTTYVYTAPDIQVPDQVVIEIASPAAVVAASPLKTVAAANGLVKPLAFPPNYQPPPTCLINAPSVLNGSQTAQNILVTSGLNSQAQCPQAPAPACIVVYNPNPDVFVCAPAQDVILAPAVALSCPPGYVEVTSQADYAELAAANGYARVCELQMFATPPVLKGPRGDILANCTPRNSKFVCVAPKLPNGVYSVLWDKEPPPQPIFSAKSTSSGTFVYKDELETDAVFNAAIIASDPHGLGSAEILEVFDTPASNIVLGKLRVERIWQAPAGTFSGNVKNWDSQTVQIPFDNSAPAKRRFKARVFDKAGNSRLSNNTVALDFFIAKIAIESFTVSPSSVQFPGGPVTLSWSQKGATTISVNNGGGTVTVPDNAIVATPGSMTVNVTGTTTFTLTATHPKRTTKTATVTVTLGADATPPSVSLAANPQTVVAPGSTTLTATASDNAAVTKVEFYRGATLIGTDMSAPFTQTANFVPADIGNVPFTAKAYDAANNNTTSSVLNVTVVADSTPPTVNLIANPATVLAPGSTTLQATASDNIGVTKVEFYRGGTLIATDTAAPFQTQVDFTLADLGTANFTAKAFDAQNNNTTSAVVSVLVTTPSAGDTYASPTGVDLNNTTCAQATPCRTIAKAAQLAQANKTVWLNNGAYNGTTQPAPIQIPAGLTLRALTPGLAGVGQAIVLQGNATVVGVVLRRVATGDSGWIEASSGIVTVDGVKAEGPYFAGGLPPLSLSGTVQVTMTPGNIADYTDALPPVQQNSYTYAELSGSARLTVNGGVFGGAVLGGADGLYGGQGRGAFRLSGG